MTTERSPAACKCPACGAGQVWSDQCRRCAADLSLLHAVERSAEAARKSCLALLAKGEAHKALRESRRLLSLRPDEKSRRLHAVCSLAAGRFRSAVETARGPTSIPLRN